MDRIKFLLINPTSPLRRADSGRRSRSPRVFRFSMLTSLYVAAAMPPDVIVEIVDEDITLIDFETDANLIGISLMTYNAPRAYKIAQRFREEQGKPVILGGYHPTLLPEEAKQHADAVCIGDAEPIVPQMIADFAAGRLKPFYRSPPASLAGLPLPRRDLIERRDYVPFDVVQATRGCSRRCTYCSVSAFHNHQWRFRPVSEVIAELKGLGRYILFMDDSLTNNRDYAKALFAEMIPLRKRWFSQCGVEIARDGELLGLAARSGCCGVFIGFESLSQDCLRSWNKGGNLASMYLDVVRRLHAAGIAVYAGFVFGSDYDTSDVFPRTLEFLLEANVESLQATRMTPFPGTALFEEMNQAGRILDRDWAHYDFGYVVYEPAHMSREMLDTGVAWVQKHFYAHSSIARRTWRALHYLRADVASRVLLSLNLGYRRKMAMDGTFERAERFVVPA